MFGHDGGEDNHKGGGFVTRVAIIVGGVGGLTAANALSRAGTEVAVYGSAAEFSEIGVGVALHPNAMKVLRAIGVDDGDRKVAGRSRWQVMRNWKTWRVIGKTSLCRAKARSWPRIWRSLFARPLCGIR
jgi:salicylate hydroxylase